MSSSYRKDLLKALDETDPGDHLRTVLHFYAFDLKKLKNCFDMVQRCVKEELQHTVKIDSYGSVATGLALRESDIDLYLTPNTYPPIGYDEVVIRLHLSKCFRRVTPYRNARVPIIRCIHNATGLTIDLNMSNPNGVYNSRFVAELVRCDTRLRELFLFLKIWATELCLIGRHGLTNHCLVSMIIFSLQVHKLLPSVQQMQSTCPTIMFQGNNYAYGPLTSPIVPKGMSTRQLITNFLDYYSNFDFEKFGVSPFLGRCLDRYREQLDFELASEKICVQDPFEQKHYLGKSLSQENLQYFRQCLVLSAQASHLIRQPKKLYDYLLFGLAEKLGREPKIMNIAYTPPMPMTILTSPTDEDFQGLRPIREALNDDKSKFMGTFFTWHTCQQDTIYDVLTKVYGLNVDSEVRRQYSLWMVISGKVDTWSGREFTPNAGQSFLSDQLQQSRDFSITRPGNPDYAVNVRAYLTVSWNPGKNLMWIMMKPLSGQQENGSLDKLFMEFQHLLIKYSFKEQASIWSFDQQSKHKRFIFTIIIVVFLSLMIPGDWLWIILFMMAILFRNFLKSAIWNSNTLTLKKNESHPKHPIYR